MLGVALPKFKELGEYEWAVTFVVPAPNGCNLNCPFCVVRARREASPDSHCLDAIHYIAFLREASRRFHVGVASIQGYEPLLPESWPYTCAILREGKALGLTTALITNGTHLAQYVDELVRLDVDGVTVSLDSADPSLHDATRRTPGAFDRTVTGLRAISSSSLRKRTMVTSVLQPGKGHYLQNMPRLLQELGVSRWVVNPLYKVGGPHGGLIGQPEETIAKMVQLQILARKQGIEMLVDDEFSKLAKQPRKVVNIEELKFRFLRRLDKVLRLSPNGSCSSGAEILDRVSDSMPHWDPRQESAEGFLDRFLIRRRAILASGTS